MKQIVLILSLIVMLTACHTVPPTVIGAETQKEITTLKEQASTATGQAEIIDASVDSISGDITNIKGKAPDDLKPEIQAIQDKMAILSGLTEAYKAGFRRLSRQQGR